MSVRGVPRPAGGPPCPPPPDRPGWDWPARGAARAPVQRHEECPGSPVGPPESAPRPPRWRRSGGPGPCPPPPGRRRRAAGTETSPGPAARSRGARVRPSPVARGRRASGTGSSARTEWAPSCLGRRAAPSRPRRQTTPSSAQWTAGGRALECGRPARRTATSPHHLQPLVHHGGGVDRDFRPHRPVRMVEGLLHRNVAKRLGRAVPERPAGRGQHELLNRPLGLARQALKNRRVLAVDGQ